MTIKLLATVMVLLTVQLSALAAVNFGARSGDNYTASWTGSQAIPDNNPSGVSFALNFGDSGVGTITSLTLSFTISGGYNGDLYAYLSHGDGLVVLMNRIGRSDINPAGSGTSGFNSGSFTIGSAHSSDVHLASGTTGQPLTGNYAPDGRDIPFDSSGWTFDNAPRTATFSTLLGDDPNGNWTLFFSDVAVFATGTLTGWELIVAVPEPTTWALIAFGTVFGVVQLVRHFRRRFTAAK